MLFVAASKIRNRYHNNGGTTSGRSHRNTKNHNTPGEYFESTLPPIITNNNTPLYPTYNQTEGQHNHKSKHKSIQIDEKGSTPNGHSNDILYSDITSIAIGRNLSKEAIINSFIHLISTTNTKQRQQIKWYYKQHYQFDINNYITQNFKGIFKRILLYSMQSKLQRDLYILTIGVKKMKDINCILPLLCTFEGDYISKLMSAYSKGMFEKTLREQIIKLTGKNALLRAFVVSILNGTRKRLPSRLLETDAIFLHNILLFKGEWNASDEMKFIDIFSRRSFAYLRTLCASFESLAEISLMDAIKNKFGGKCKNNIGYAINCMLMYVLDSGEYYRKLLMKGIVSGGHKYILFWRIIINEMDYNLLNILNSYGLYEGGKSDVDTYNLYHFIRVTLNKEDEYTSKLLLKICKF